MTNSHPTGYALTAFFPFKLLNGLGLIAAALVCLGFLGKLHPALDAIAIGRWVGLYCAIGFCLVSATLQRRACLISVLGLALAFALAGHQWVMRAAPSYGETVRLYSKNLLYSNPDQEAVAEDILAVGPDIVFLQEVSRRSGSILDRLAPQYPHRSVCPLEGWNSMAVLSKRPFLSQPACSPERSLMAVEFDSFGGPAWAVNVHLQHPWPDYQWDHLNMALPVLAHIDPMDDRVIVAGDFNTMPWVAAAQTIGARTGTKALRPALPTYHLWGLGLPLDQVWAKSGTVMRRAKLSSDHHGILAEVGF